MRYVILRDDDTNAFTPVECLERLYRPFLDRRLPVNLAAIPRVRTDTLRADGQPEEFLFGAKGSSRRTLPITENVALINYLHANDNYCVAQHGYDHTMNEFDSEKPDDVRERLDQGRQLLEAAGFARPATFVAPYDKYSQISLQEVARQFRVFSTGWFEWRRMPAAWWFFYAFKKVLGRPHWRMGQTQLLSHPGCLLSRHRPYPEMLNCIKNAIARQQLTVLVTHWWEYFRDGQPNQPFIRVLHDTAEWLANEPDVKVVSFNDVANGKVALA